MRIPCSPAKIHVTWYWTTLMIDAVEGHGGRVQQMTGDGLSAIFGPSERSTGGGASAWCGVQAAKEMSELVRQFNIERIAAASRGHWGVESMHWLLDVEFKDDLSRYRAGNGAKNMATIRRFSLNLVRANKRKGSVKTRRKTAGWNTEYLMEILSLPPR